MDLSRSKTVLITCTLLIVCILASGCASVFSDIQSAKLVGRGNFEYTPSYSLISSSSGGNTQKVQDNFGVQAGYGLSEVIDLRLRYEVLLLSQGGTSSAQVHVLGFGPKIGIVENTAALYLPVGFAFGENIGKVKDTWEIHPTFLFSLPVGENFEINPSVKALIPITRENADVLVALNLGAGLSTDFEIWAVRPEVGFLFNPGENGFFMHFSFGWTIYR